MLIKDISRSRMGDKSKFMKDPAERAMVFDVLYANIEKLLDHYLYIIGSRTESYPVIGFTLLVESLKTLGLYSDSDKTLISEDLQGIMFSIPMDYEACGKPLKNLCRNEFFEILVRVAKIKYN